jgi:hypothetical protein
MLKMVPAGLLALFVAVSPPAQAQAPSAGERDHIGAELSALTEARINIVKVALQLTPDQEKYWPAVEDAIRARAKDRQARMESLAKRVDDLRERGAIEALRDRDPVAFLQRRADALAQRSADLKKLADAWQPLYQTLSPDQKRRMGLLTVLALREIRDGLQQRQMTTGMGHGMGMWMGMESDDYDED